MGPSTTRHRDEQRIKWRLARTGARCRRDRSHLECSTETASSAESSRLLFLTGCRRNEIAKLEWDEVGEDLISISSSRTKNHLQFDVPLTDLARDLIGPPERAQVCLRSL